MELNISIFNAFVNSIEEAENNIKSAYLYADSVKLYDYTMMMYPHINELKKLYVKRGQYITPSDIDFLLDKINTQLFDLTCEQYEEYYAKKIEQIQNSPIFKLTTLYQTSINDQMSIEDFLMNAKTDFIKSDTYHMFNESDIGLQMFDSGIESFNDTSAHLANFMFTQLPAFKNASADEIVDIKKELSSHIVKFRSSLLSLSDKLETIPSDKNFMKECKTLFIKEVEPAVEEIKQSIRDNNILKNIASNIFTQKETWESLGAMAVAYSSGNNILSTISFCGALGLAGYSVSKSIQSVSQISKTIKSKELYFYYETGVKLEKSAGKTKRTILINHNPLEDNSISSEVNKSEEEPIDLSNLNDFFDRKVQALNSEFQQGNTLGKGMTKNELDICNEEIQNNLDTLIEKDCSAKNYLKRAAFFVQKEDFVSAMSDIQTAQKLDSGTFVLISCAQLYLDIGEYTKCIDIASRLIKQMPNNAALLKMRAKAYFCNKKFDEALWDTNKYVGLEPNDVYGYVNRFTIYKTSGKYTEAINDISKAIMLAEDIQKEQLTVLRAQFYIDNKEFENAISDLNYLISSCSKSIELYNMRSKCYYELGKYDDALNDIEFVLKINPEDIIALFNKTKIINVKLNKEEDGEFLDDAIEINNRPESLLYLRAQNYMNNNKYHDAIKDLMELIEKDDRHIVLFVRISDCYYHLSMYDKALQNINSALERLPDSEILILKRAHIYREMGFIDEALNDINSLMKNENYPIKYLYERAVIKGECGRHKEAIEDLNLFIKRDNTVAVSYHDRGYYLSLIGKHLEAINDFSKAIELDSQPYYVQNRAITWMELENYLEALNDFKQLVEDKVATPETYAYMGVCYDHIGKEKEAIESLNVALEMNPYCEIAYKQLGTILLHKKKFEKAIEMYSKAIELDSQYIAAYKERAEAYEAIGNIGHAALDMKIVQKSENKFS